MKKLQNVFLMCGSGQSFCKKVCSLLFCRGVVYNFCSILNMLTNPMEFDVDVSGFCFCHWVVGEVNHWEIVTIN